ncbi:hypothetical protein [Streptomyces sp. NBC_00401]|uniref:hypothetical protein n=1 Tax=Streptomyces sp. NBC_00401 TaxID=2975738 RepID=UPI0022592A79|nr:hypothetical protein [Streptomyces sp. NBC_00401]MCX5082727.1 hypothetical protein [Streptomyces sp. NBC_00401]
MELAFQPVENGMDYLLSVTRHLADRPTPRDLKYAVLHLHSAVEVLLKARLLQEHWALVFEKPESATRVQYEEAEFKSCGVVDAFKRLESIAGIDLGYRGRVEQHVGKLVKWRNALQHFGLTAPAPAVEKTAVNILDFLLEFVQNHLRPALDKAGRVSLDDEMTAVSDGLGEIKRLVSYRWSRIRADLDKLRDETVTCGMCDQAALVVNGRESACRFCQFPLENGEDAAMLYAEFVLNRPVFDERDVEPVVDECPDCSTNTLVQGAVMASGRTAGYLCFQCGLNFDHWGICDECHAPMLAVRGISVCGTCINNH